MKRLVILLAVCAIGFARRLDYNEIEFLKENDFFEDDFQLKEHLETKSEEFSRKLFKFLSKSYQPEVDPLNDLLLHNLNGTKFNEALAKDHPHAHLSTVEIAQLYNYTVEKHQVETEDGYILELHRITGNEINPSPQGKPPVFLMHGLIASSVDWVLTGPQKGLAFLLADAGYDVWLGNARGNTYSRSHNSVSPKKKKFWTFTWHEIGISDLSAMIDYVLKETQNEKLTYVGHSQGSTTFLVLLSERPEYNDKIKVMLSLAPVAYCSQMLSPFLKFFATYEKYIRSFFGLFGPWEVLPNRGVYKWIIEAICKGSFAKLCTNAIFIIAGYNEEQFDEDLLPAVTAHYPAGASLYQISHYAQLIKSGKFRQFDDSLIGSSNPPYYNLQNVKVPIFLHYASNDWLSNVEDVKILKSELPNVVNMTEVPDKLFNHIDFLFAKDVKTLLYDDILNNIAKYNT